jgi:mono/diheme cytochrome c family protein
MRFLSAVLACSCTYGIAVGAALSARTVQDQPKTTWDGVFTEAQAKRGEAIYTESCAGCHGPDLAGLDTAPSLTGPDFNMDWADLPVDDLFERVRTTMPADNVGGLTREQYADVVAYVLSKDNFPAGASELPSDNAALKQIKFVAQKPAP